MMEGSKVVRRAPRIAASGVIEIPHWTYVDQDNPATVGAPNPLGTITLKSDIENSYEGSSGGKKIIYKFRRVRACAWSNLYYLGHLLSFGTVLSYTWPSSGTSYLFQLVLRLRGIANDFDIEALTWNNVVAAPALTFGLDVEYKRSVRLKPSVNDTITLSNDNKELVTMMNARLDMDETTPFYGLILDVKPIGSAAAIARLAQWPMIVRSNTSTSEPKPFIYVQR